MAPLRSPNRPTRSGCRDEPAPDRRPRRLVVAGDRGRSGAVGPRRRAGTRPLRRGRGLRAGIGREGVCRRAAHRTCGAEAVRQAAARRFRRPTWPGTDDGLAATPVASRQIRALRAYRPDVVVATNVSRTGHTNLLHVEHLIREAEQAPRDPAGQELDLLTTGTGRTSSLGTQLTRVARCVKAGVPTRVYSVSLDGFHTHADELPGHERLLKRLDDALSTFVTRMSRTEAGRQVTVVVYSEFGRRVRANASDGTDHGTAGPVLVLGPPGGRRLLR